MSNNQNSMIVILSAGVTVKDSAIVSSEGFTAGSNTDWQRSVFQGSSHLAGIIRCHTGVVSNSNNSGSIIFAVSVLGGVRVGVFSCDGMISSISEGGIEVSTIAATVFFGAVDELLL